MSNIWDRLGTPCDYYVRDDDEPRPRRRRKRKPSVAQIFKQAKKAGGEVTIAPDGSITFKSSPQPSAESNPNPWEAEVIELASRVKR